MSAGFQLDLFDNTPPEKLQEQHGEARVIPHELKNLIGDIKQEDCLKTMARMPKQSISLCVAYPHSLNWAGFVDKMNNDEYFDWSVARIKEMIRVSKLTVYIVKFNTSTHQGFLKLLGYLSQYVADIAIWDYKLPQVCAADKTMSKEFEFLLFLTKSGINRRFEMATFKKNTLSNIFKIPDTRRNNEPVLIYNLAGKIIQNFSKENDIVYFPFAGTSEGIVAAIELKRLWIGSEVCKDLLKTAIENIKEEMNKPKLF